MLSEGELVSYTWEQLGRLVRDCCDLWQGKALQVGDHVATALPNSLDWIVIDVACQSLGLVHVAIDVREPVGRRHRLFEHSEAVLRIEDPYIDPRESFTRSPGTTQRVAHHFCRRLVDQQLSRPAQMLFTSGTTGESKGVVLSHRNLLTNAWAKLAAAPQYPWDVRLNVLPFSHAYARTCELSTWILTAGQLVVVRSWDELLSTVDVARPTLINLVPYLAEKLLHVMEAEPRCLGGRLRLLQVGGAALPDEVFGRLAACGIPPLQGYGLTEASPVICSNRAGYQRPGVVGPPVQGTEIHIDSAGNLWAKGPQIMLGYWRDQRSTNEVIHDGWLLTGDLAERDEDGGIRIVGRKSSQFVLSTGYVVSPEPIERSLLRDPWIDQAVVVGDGNSHPIAKLWPQFDQIPDAFFTAQKKTLATLRRTPFLRELHARLTLDPDVAMDKVEIRLLTQPLSHRAGTLSAKGSVRRSRVATLETVTAGNRRP